jgi:hypothetical protein
MRFDDWEVAARSGDRAHEGGAPVWAGRPAPAATAVLTRRECAAWLGISPRQLARLEVPCAKLGRLVRYSVPAVLQYLAERGRP